MSRRRAQALAALAAVGISGYSSVAIPVLAGSLEADLSLGKGTLGLLPFPWVLAGPYGAVTIVMLLLTAGLG